MFKKSLLAVIIASSLGSVAAPTLAQDFGYRNAPPPPRYEVVPPPRHGYVWVPGYWERRGHRDYWVQGTWVRERRGHRFDQPHWVQRDGRWYFVQGRWQRGDRDGDGVPNQYDRRPNDPRRY